MIDEELDDQSANLSCKGCSKTFDFKNYKPYILPTCMHTICKLCILSKLQTYKNEGYFLCEIGGCQSKTEFQKANPSMLLTVLQQNSTVYKAIEDLAKLKQARENARKFAEEQLKLEEEKRVMEALRRNEEEKMAEERRRVFCDSHQSQKSRICLSKFCKDKTRFCVVCAEANLCHKQCDNADFYDVAKLPSVVRKCQVFDVEEFRHKMQQKINTSMDKLKTAANEFLGTICETVHGKNEEINNFKFEEVDQVSENLIVKMGENGNELVVELEQAENLLNLKQEVELLFEEDNPMSFVEILRNEILNQFLYAGAEMIRLQDMKNQQHQEAYTRLKTDRELLSRLPKKKNDNLNESLLNLISEISETNKVGNQEETQREGDRIWFDCSKSIIGPTESLVCQGGKFKGRNSRETNETLFEEEAKKSKAETFLFRKDKSEPMVARVDNPQQTVIAKTQKQQKKKDQQFEKEYGIINEHADEQEEVVNTSMRAIYGNIGNEVGNNSKKAIQVALQGETAESKPVKNEMEAPKTQEGKDCRGSEQVAKSENNKRTKKKEGDLFRKLGIKDEGGDERDTHNTSMREVFQDYGAVTKQTDNNKGVKQQVEVVLKKESRVEEEVGVSHKKHSLKPTKDEVVSKGSTAKLNVGEAKGEIKVSGVDSAVNPLAPSVKPLSYVSFFDKSEFQNVKPKRTNEQPDGLWMTSDKIAVVSKANHHVLKPSDQNFLGRFCVVSTKPIGKSLKLELEVKKMSIRDRFVLVGLVSAKVRDVLVHSQFRCPMLDESVSFNGYDKSLAFKGKCDIKYKNAINGLESKSRVSVVVDGNSKTIRVWDGKTYGCLFDLTADYGAQLGGQIHYLVVGLDSPSTEVELTVIEEH